MFAWKGNRAVLNHDGFTLNFSGQLFRNLALQNVRYGIFNSGGGIFTENIVELNGTDFSGTPSVSSHNQGIPNAP